MKYMEKNIICTSMLMNRISNTDLNNTSLMHGDAIAWVLGQLVKCASCGTMDLWVWWLKIGHKRCYSWCLSKCNTIVSPHTAPCKLKDQISTTIIACTAYLAIASHRCIRKWSLSCERVNYMRQYKSDASRFTVVASLASSGTTPWSVSTPRFSSSLAILAIAAHTAARTSRSSDFSRPTISSRPPTKDRTSSPASFAFSIQGHIAQAAHACTWI